MATADPVATSSPSLWSRIAPSPKGMDGGGGGWAKSLFRRPQDNASQSRFVEMFDDNYQVGAPPADNGPADAVPMARKKKQKTKSKRQSIAGAAPPAAREKNDSPNDASPPRPSAANGNGVRRRSSLARLMSRDKAPQKPITFEDMAADPSARPPRRSLSLSRSKSASGAFGGSPVAEQKKEVRERDTSPLASGSSGSFDGNGPVDYAPESLIRAFAQSEDPTSQASAPPGGEGAVVAGTSGIAEADGEQYVANGASGEGHLEVDGDDSHVGPARAHINRDELDPLEEVSNVEGEHVAQEPVHTIPDVIDEDKPVAQPGTEGTLRRGGSVKRSDSTRRRSFAPLGSTVGQLDLSGLPHHRQGDSQLSRRLSLSRTRSNVEPRTLGLDDLVGADLTRKSSVKSKDPQARDTRRSSFAPLGSLAGPMDMPLLGRSGTTQEDGTGHRLSLSLSRTRSNAQVAPRTIGLDEMSAEPALTRTRSVKIAADTDGGRRSSFAPLGSMAGGFELNQLGRRSSRSAPGASLFRTQSASEPREARDISFADLSQEPARTTKRVEDDNQRTRRTSFAPLGSNVGELDFRGLGKRSEQPLGLEKMSAEPGLKRKPSIKFAPDVASRRRSFAPLGSSVGEFDFRGLGKGGQSRSADEGELPIEGNGENGAQLRPTISAHSRRSSQDIVQLARQTSRGLGRRLSQVFGGSQEEKPTVALEEMSSQSGLQRAGSQSRKGESGDGRRRSIAGLGSLVQPLDFKQLDRNKEGLVKRLSLKRSRSKGKASATPAAAADSDEVTATRAPDAPEEPVSDNEVYATPPDSGDPVAERPLSDLVADQPSDTMEQHAANIVEDNDAQGATETTTAKDTTDAPIQLAESLAATEPTTSTEGHPQPEVLAATGIISGELGELDVDEQKGKAIATSTGTGDPDESEHPNETGTPILEGFLTYQTEKERSWRRTRYRLYPGELTFVDPESPNDAGVKHALSAGEPVLTEYAASQAEGSFSIPTVAGDSVERYFVFCDSAAEREKLLQGLETAKSK